MLAFAPLSSNALATTGFTRETISASVTGLEATASVGTINLSVSSKITDQPIRKSGTTFRFKLNVNSIPIHLPLENDDYFWTNAFILGMRAQDLNNNADGRKSPPVWDESVAGSRALSLQTKIVSTLSSEAIVSRHAFAPVSNGDYTFSATYDSSLGYDSIPKPLPVEISHLPETITNGAATITSLSNPPLGTISFPPADSTLFDIDPSTGQATGDNQFLGAVVGQVRTLNTYDTTNSDTYFSDSLMIGSCGQIDFPGITKSHELFGLNATNKGFQIGPVRIGTFGTNKSSITSGAAYVVYGKQLQPQITASHFPNGLPVSQEHTFGTTLAVGTIEPIVQFELPAQPIAAAIGNLTVNVKQPIDGVSIGQVRLPNPQWFLNPYRIQLVAKANQPADSTLYPYLPSAIDTGPLQQDFKSTVSLGALSSPIAISTPVNGLASTTSVGSVDTRSFNTLAVNLPNMTFGLGNLQPNVVEIIADNFEITAEIGEVTTESFSKPIVAGLDLSASISAVTATGSAKEILVGVETVLTLNTNISVSASSKIGLKGNSLHILQGRISKQIFAVVPSITPMQASAPSFAVLSPSNCNFAYVDRKVNHAKISTKISALG